MYNISLIQNVLNIIDSRVTEEVTPRKIARENGYSTIHFSRLFSEATGITLMAYITRHKLQYALYDLGRGEKVIDVAVKYGFETHAGFTKAFKKCFGYPPSIYRIHAICSRPTKMGISELKNMVSGGNILYPEIVQMEPLTVVGFTSHHKMPRVKFTHDVPLYWDTTKMNCADPLTRLHNLFSKSRHSEVTVCFDINPQTSEFTYLLGVGVDNKEDLAKTEPDMYTMKMPGGLYAKFTTPRVENAKYSRTVRDTWKSALEK